MLLPLFWVWANLLLKLVEVKLPDDTEVDLSQWAMPGKHTKRQMPEFSWESVLLCGGIIIWNMMHGLVGCQQAARVGSSIHWGMCMSCKGSNQWEWNQGSQFFFGWFPEEWLADLHNTVEFCHVAPPLKGHFKNVLCARREAELPSHIIWYFGQSFVITLRRTLLTWSFQGFLTQRPWSLTTSELFWIANGMVWMILFSWGAF